MGFQHAYKKRRKNTIKQDFNIKDFKQINCNSSSFKTIRVIIYNKVFVKIEILNHFKYVMFCLHMFADLW